MKTPNDSLSRSGARRAIVAAAALLLSAAWPQARAADPPPPNAAATDAADAFGERFLVMQATTDLERRLLGNHDGPSREASACVFVDSREFAGEAPLSAKSRPFLLLAAWLEEQAKVDNRLVIFKVVDVVENEPFDAVKARAEGLAQICDELGRNAGYRQVKSTQTYGVDLKERIDQAQDAARKQAANGAPTPPTDNATDKSFAGNERLGVYAVRTMLERLLVHADCVVDVRPVLRQTAGNKFPDDFIVELQALVPQVQCDERRILLLDIHYLEAVQPTIDKWINNRVGRLAFAKRFGFEDCHLQMSLTDAVDEAAGGEASDDKPAIQTEPPLHRAGEPFELTVVGPDRKPIPGITVDFRVDQPPEADHIVRGKLISRDQRRVVVQADDEGRITLPLPDRFTIEVVQAGFGPYWGAWNNGAPSRFTAELDAGWSVGGVVVDEQGAPVKGATVHPSIELKKRPGDGQQMAIGNFATTDARGAWHFDSVPASAGDVFVTINHDDFMPLRQRLSRDDYGLADDQDPGARIALKRGLTIEGVVTDDAEKPIAGALVRTKFLNELREATTDADGRYTLVGCEPTETRIVASAPGRAIDLQLVRVEPDMEPVNFRLQPGATIRVRVIDAAGKPVPKTRIFFQRWRGEIDYFEFDHVNDLSDDQGVWEWNEAPRDEIQADICPPDGIQIPNQPLVARDQEYVFTARPPLAIAGAVVDAKTGQPVEKFRAVLGILSRPDHIDWARRDSSAGVEGRYRVEADRIYPGQVVRIEADGYAPAVSREVKSDEGEVTIDFKLEKAAPLASTILTPSGARAAGAKLAIGVAGAQIDVRNGDIDDSSTYAARVTADDAGKIQFPAQDGPFKLVITHPTGFAYIASEEQKIPEKITLTGWARVEGVFRVGAQPRAGVTLDLNSESLMHSYGKGQPSIFVSHQATTGADGRFTFERVYPGQGRVGRRIVYTGDAGAAEATSSKMEPISLVAGETTPAELGGRGRPVVGKLAPRAGFKGKVTWSFATLHLEINQPQAPPADPNDPLAAEKQRAWLKSQQRRAEKAPYYYVSVDRDGGFRIDDVPPGEYALSVRFDNNQAAGRLDKVVITVPPMDGNRSDEPLDVGELPLAP
jgi:protocatechuate 3,4-dioxygenase beta subunit